MSFNQTSNIESGNFVPGDTVFVMYNSVLLLLMIPGFSFFYSGLTNPGSSLTVLMTPFIAIVVVSLQWWLVGYSLAFSQTSGPFIGDFSNTFLRGVYMTSYPIASEIPELAFSFYQCVTAMLPASILLGAIAERGRLLPAILFILIWTTFVYDIICYWSLNPKGWSYQMGALDYGGASPVHVPSATAALAYSLVLGPLARPTDFHKPRNMNQVIVGTTLIWIGSYGNLAGAAMKADVRGTLATQGVTLAASAGAITWCFLDYWKFRKLTAIGFCSGVVAAQVAITPAAGFVSPFSSILIGCISAFLTNMASLVREKYQLNDVLEVFALHGVSGIVGAISTGVLSRKFYGGDMMLDGGWLDGNSLQVAIQLADLMSTSLWSFVFSYITLFLWNKTALLRLRVDPEIELRGLDEGEVGISSYEMNLSSTSKF